MSQPVKLSDALVLDARLAAEVQERSIAGQVEFWAKLGRSVDFLLGGQRVLELRRSGEVQPLSEILASVDTPEGRERVAAYLENQPYPHFEQYPGSAGLLVRIDLDGTRTVGRFVNREFVAVKASIAKVETPRKKSVPVLKDASPRSAVQSPGSAKREVKAKSKAKPAPDEREAWA
jgi:hypothetical protein